MSTTEPTIDDNIHHSRVEAALDEPLANYKNRARKLYPYSYKQTGRVYGVAFAADVARLSFDNVVVLPRSA